MKILVTGGAGYIGSTLVPMLLYKGHEVTVFDKLNWGIHPLMHVAHMSNLKIIQGDVINREQVSQVISGVDVIIHLAAIVGFPACEADPDNALATNISGTKNIADFKLKNQILIFASTGSCYGYVDGICTEEVELKPLSLYAKSKVRGEELVRAVGGICLRFATVYGLSPRIRLDLLINNLAYKAFKDAHIQLYEGNFRRTFLHVRDAARAILLTINNEDAMSGQTFNVGDELLNKTKMEVVQIIQRLLPECKVSFTSTETDQDKRDYEVSYRKFKQFGFQHTCTIEDGIMEMLKVFPFISLKETVMYFNVK